MAMRKTLKRHLVVQERVGLFTLCGRPFRKRFGAWLKAESLADCTCEKCLTNHQLLHQGLKEA